MCPQPEPPRARVFPAVCVHSDPPTSAFSHRSVVPCCVFARELPKFLPSGEPVTTYEQLCDFIDATVERLLNESRLAHEGHIAAPVHRAFLPFVGRNTVLYWDPKRPDVEPVFCEAAEDETA